MDTRAKKPTRDARINWGDDTLAVDFTAGHSLAIDLEPNRANPNFFSESKVTAKPLTVGSFVGDMKQGGSCNAEVIEFSTHSHGTHTECVGHISADHESVIQTIDQQPTLLRLISIDASQLPPDLRISPDLLPGLEGLEGGALAIRTLPNDNSKRWKNYDQSPEFPVLSEESMRAISQSGLVHLLLDTPSLDSPDDENLINHRTWWGLNSQVKTGVSNPNQRSITEMIFVPDDIADGEYWLDLQMPPLISDAVPSRPMIYPVKREKGTQT